FLHKHFGIETSTTAIYDEKPKLCIEIKTKVNKTRDITSNHARHHGTEKNHDETMTTQWRCASYEHEKFNIGLQTTHRFILRSTFSSLHSVA
uniref:Uncharacterized protein n=1 Tax=Strigamia maritima TaxID=126957 RepID=T1J3L7_STRMM